MPKIMFRSTNRKAPLVSFKEALMRGQAPDYGLYMPTAIPKLTKEEIDSFRNKEYYEIAFEIAKKFLKDEISDAELKRICKESYNFEVPLEKVKDNLFIMRLDRGPTASFKDFAARMMARLMGYFAKQEKRALHVLVATSGDTGGAVADAFYGVDNIKVTVLFPENEISERQRKQMTTLGKNVTAIAVKGKFDDCQTLVKRAFNDSELKDLNLSSANSISFGRLMPQIVYYIYAYSRLAGDKVIFSVPSGNFGNLMGGVIAKEMGLNIERFIVAVNENDEFPKFLESGNYRAVVPSKECSSNAMNVGHPSNLARLIDLYGGWLTDERAENGKVLMSGVLKEKPDMEKLRKDFVSFSISDRDVDETIKSFYNKYKIIIEPHGAVGLVAFEKAGLNGLTVCLETADPAKFPDKIKELLGIDPKVSECLSKLDGKKEEFETIHNDYREFKRIIQ
ncbi:MAG: threonine synthase [Nanoarchaeota archaeon]|nr:threonine synthase [Nanoarchaeota archaeon]MBU1004893.1 threonine synthase [Nanoarchaeota archaeon]MBU1945396.1 threonine synthase [Nanoarchaeota archaeon]